MKNAATTGMALGSDPDFSQGDSLAACNMYNMTKGALAQAAKGDLILCYVQALASQAEDSVDVYDGNFHAFNLNFDDGDQGGNGPPDLIKFRVVKNSSGEITDFTMYACRNGQQAFYLNQSINGTSLTMTSIDSDSRGGEHVEVAGSLNGSGQFEGTKTIDIQSTYADNTHGFDGHNSVHFEQTSDTVLAHGYNTGSFSGGFTDPSSHVAFTCTGSHTDSGYAKAELLNGDATDIGDMAVGDGAAKNQNSGSNSCSGSSGSFTGSWNQTDVIAWNGDTLLDEPTNDFVSAVQDQTLDSAGTVTVAFTGDQVYDCSDTPTITITGRASDVTQCANLNLDHSWVDCYTLTQPQPH
jgi:hypothetical protein